MTDNSPDHAERPNTPELAKLIEETVSRGEWLRCGDYLGEWEEGDHPYGQPKPCPFCQSDQRYTNLWYNGPGSPPSYAWQCDECGAQGPTSNGQFRGDHYGAIIAARELWDAADLSAVDAILRRWSVTSDNARPSIKLGLLRRLRAALDTVRGEGESPADKSETGDCR